MCMLMNDVKPMDAAYTLLNKQIMNASTLQMKKIFEEKKLH